MRNAFEYMSEWLCQNPAQRLLYLSNYIAKSSSVSQSGKYHSEIDEVDLQ